MGLPGPGGEAIADAANVERPQALQAARRWSWPAERPIGMLSSDLPPQIPVAWPIAAILHHGYGRGGEAVCNRVSRLGCRAVPADDNVRLTEVEPAPCSLDLEHGVRQPGGDVECFSPAHRLHQVRPESVRQGKRGELQREYASSNNPANHVRPNLAVGLADLPWPPHVSRGALAARCSTTARNRRLRGRCHAAPSSRPEASDPT